MERSFIFHLSRHLSQYITLDTDDGDTGCDGTLRHTQAWLQAHDVDQEAWLRWLHERGAWCDCGVVEEILLWDPAQLGENTPFAPTVQFRNWPPEA